jgi:hypothetical protein
MCVVALVGLMMVGVGVAALANYVYVGDASGWLNGRGDFELVRTDLRSSRSYLVTVTVPWNADFELVLFNNNGDPVWVQDSDRDNVLACTNGGFGVTEVMYVTPPSTGTYYICVLSYSGSGSFTVTMSRWY